MSPVSGFKSICFINNLVNSRFSDRVPEAITSPKALWDFIIDEYGIMAYSLNPNYYSKIWLLEITDEKVEWEHM